MDIEGTLDPGMYLSGALTIMGGLVMCVVPIHRKFTSESVVKVVEIEMKSPEEI